MEKEKVYPSIFYRNFKKTLTWGGKILEYSNLGTSPRFKSQNVFFFSLRFIRDNFSTSITFLRYLVLPWQHLFQLCLFFFFITGKMYFPTSLCYLPPCEITILRALGPAQYGTFHYSGKDCSESNKPQEYIDFSNFSYPDTRLARAIYYFHP